LIVQKIVILVVCSDVPDHQNSPPHQPKNHPAKQFCAPHTAKG